MQKAFEDIVERLEEEIDDVIVKDTYTRGKNSGLRKAKIIVSQVASEYTSTELINCSTEEVCEWREDMTLSRSAIGHGKFESLMYTCKWKYCPYCGKKIKVVE